MESNGIPQDISELNLAYLLLAKRLVAENEVEAMFRLGISKETARILTTLTPGQMVKLATCNVLLCRLRLDASMLEALANPASTHDMQSIHAAILLASTPSESEK